MKKLPPPKKAQGRGTSSFVQARRLDALRAALETQTQGHTLEDLAGMLGITDRSVRRYLKQLERTVELESVELTRGGAHAWRIKPSARARTLPLRRSQAYALLAARRVFEPLRGSALFDELEITFRELEKLATRPGRTAQQGELSPDAHLEGRFFAVVPRGPRLPGRGEELDALFSAVAARHVITARWQERGQSRDLRVEPYAMVLEHGRVIMVGKDLQAGGMHAWPFDQLSDVSMTQTRYELPRGFDVEPYYGGAFGFEDHQDRVRVVVEFDDEAALEARRMRLHPEQVVQHTRDGRKARIAFMVTDLERVKRWVLGFGAQARVIEPAALAHEVAREIGKMNALYT